MPVVDEGSTGSEESPRSNGVEAWTGQYMQYMQ